MSVRHNFAWYQNDRKLLSWYRIGNCRESKEWSCRSKVLFKSESDICVWIRVLVVLFCVGCYGRWADLLLRIVAAVTVVIGATAAGGVALFALLGGRRKRSSAE